MRIFRPKRRTGGRTQDYATWYVDFVDPIGVRRRMPAFSDKAASLEFGRRLEKLIALRSVGDAPDAELARWIETLPERMRATLAGWGILDPARLSRARALVEHATEFEGVLKARGNSAVHVDKTIKRVRRILDGCRFAHVSDLTCAAVERFLHGLRERGMSVKTSNHYTGAIKEFAGWLVQERRMSENPFTSLHGRNPETDRRHVRRSFTPDELRLLLATAEAGPVRRRMTGPERATLYLVAAESGLRVSELASLTRGDFDLDADFPCLTVQAKHAKSRRTDTVPLRRETADHLRTFLADKLPGAKVFPALPVEGAARLLRADLQDAGIDARDNGAGLLDFHSLRVTLATNLGRSHVHPRVAMALMRHTSLGMTLGIYTRFGRNEEAEALETLPSLVTGSGPSRIPALATGTDGPIRGAVCGAFWDGQERFPADTDGLEAGEAEEGGIVRKPAWEAGSKATATGCGADQRDARDMELRGLEPLTTTAQPAKSQDVAQTPPERVAVCGAFWDATDAELDLVIQSWKGLPEAIRKGILAMVRSANPDSGR